jgi:hypothetical protein
VDAGVERVAPEIGEHRGGRVAGDLVRLGAGQEQDVLGQLGGRPAQLLGVHDREELLAGERVAASVRDLETHAGEAAVSLDDTPDEPGVGEQGSRLASLERAVEVGQVHAGPMRPRAPGAVEDFSCAPSARHRSRARLWRKSGGVTEAARAIWERYQVPVIYVTAYADEGTLGKVKTMEAYGYIVKPFKPAEVHAAIQVAP